MDIECETCPIRYYCPVYKEALEDNQASYHPQSVVRASEWDCPLIELVKQVPAKADGK